MKPALDLFIGRRRTDISIHPDPTHPGMWRVHQPRLGYGQSGPTTDAAISWARAGCSGGFGSRDVVYWQSRESPPEACYSEFSSRAVI
jgi:hypothetical protein